MDGLHKPWPNGLPVENGLPVSMLYMYVGQSRGHLSDHVAVARKGKLQEPHRQRFFLGANNSDLLRLLAANLIKGVWD